MNLPQVSWKSVCNLFGYVTCFRSKVQIRSPTAKFYWFMTDLKIQPKCTWPHTRILEQNGKVWKLHKEGLTKPCCSLYHPHYNIYNRDDRHIQAVSISGHRIIPFKKSAAEEDLKDTGYKKKSRCTIFKVLVTLLWLSSCTLDSNTLTRS